jgi:pyridoxal phosphate enzyme (YggS family)
VHFENRLGNKRATMNPSAETGEQNPGGSSIESRLAAVQGRIAEAAARTGRQAGDITLVAVSKTHPPESVSAVLAAGQNVFGESRVQEARAKIPLVPGRACWHFIGHLQRNKIRHALPLFELFHGVDSLEIARDIERIAAEDGALPRVLLEVNVAGEGSKFGFSPEKLRSQIEELLTLKRLTIEGLMCIPPPQPRAEMSRKFFTALRELRDQLEKEFRISLPQLSMGMSGDFPVAVEEGATLVRVGTAIFGERSGKTWRPEASGE